MTKKQQLITLIGIGVFILIPVVWIIAIQATGSPKTSSTTIIDIDTGETFNPEAKINTGGNIEGQSPVQLFGIKNIAQLAVDKSLATGFVSSVRDALGNYSKDRLKEEFSTLTLRPQNLTVGSDVISGEIRLGQTDVILPIQIALSSKQQAAVVTINKDGSLHGGTFVFVGGVNNPENLLYKITQKDDRSSELIITAYQGYRELALKYIESLGYNIPDFLITINNYRNPYL